MLSNNNARKTATKKGNCEASHFDGGGVEVNLTLSFGDIWLCDECYKVEQDTIRLSTKVIENAKEIDNRIEIAPDIYNAVTVPFTELNAAIQQNPEIPADRKKIAMADICSERVDTLSAAIFDKKQTLKQLENERLAWQQNLQNLVGSLHEKQQEKYKKYRVDYKPTPAPKPNKPKSTGTGTSGKSAGKPTSASGKVAYNKAALLEAAAKYGVPANTVRFLQVANPTWTFEQAAKELAEIMTQKKN